MAFTKEYFDEGIYRMGTRCEKWDELRQREGGDILPQKVKHNLYFVRIKKALFYL